MNKLLSNYFHIMLIVISLTSITTILLLFRNTHLDRQYYYENIFMPRHQLVIETNNKTISNTNVDCSLFEQRGLTCIESVDQNILYLPFDVLRKKFDLQVSSTANRKFKIFFTNSKIYRPKRNYNSCEEYLWFDSVNVEPRDRVKYVSLEYNVPISNQWNKLGHIYPIQVSQYGLSHYSKWIQLKRHENDITYEMKRQPYVHKLIVDAKSKFIRHENQNAQVKASSGGFQFTFPDKAIYKTNYTFDIRYLVADVTTTTSFELLIDLMIRDAELISGNYIIRLIYAFSNLPGQIQTVESLEKAIKIDQTYQVNYRISTDFNIRPLKFIRNICLDACKGLKLKCENCFKPLSETIIPNNGTLNSRSLLSKYFKVYQIALKGNGTMTNSSLREQAPHLHIATMTADYLIQAQNKSTGGWPINVTRKFDSKSNIYLEPGWYSAMAQGQAISLLCRVYAETKEDKYLKSAADSLKLFDVNVVNNGVKATFLNTSLIWFEEYPTKPHSIFVLNGFIYSMMGLNDFANGCMKHTSDKSYLAYKLKAEKLFNDALKSLLTLINLFDTGTRTFYDLRHVISPTVNPNVCRWDYHVLHVSQLFYLANIVARLEDDRQRMSQSASLLRNVATRWLEYSQGISNKNTQIKFL